MRSSPPPRRLRALVPAAFVVGVLAGYVLAFAVVFRAGHERGPVGWIQGWSADEGLAAPRWLELPPESRPEAFAARVASLPGGPDGAKERFGVEVSADCSEFPCFFLLRPTPELLADELRLRSALLSTAAELGLGSVRWPPQVIGDPCAGSGAVAFWSVPAPSVHRPRLHAAAARGVERRMRRALGCGP
jgi:hypothetical protein